MVDRSQHISIVMGTLNGARFLAPQLHSITAQSHRNWSLILSDDRSTDGTCQIARDIIPPARLSFRHGPHQGVARNFLSALAQVPDGHTVAFCDQDDVWLPDKLARALATLGHQTRPALYTAGRYVTDAGLNWRKTQLRRASTGFWHCLLRNRAAGHTCVLNPAAVKLLQSTLPDHAVPFHDWWAALIILGMGGDWVHDPHPVLLYRQHSGNVFGASGGRSGLLLRGQYLRWVRQNCAALTQVEPLLTPSARHELALCKRWLRVKS